MNKNKVIRVRFNDKSSENINSMVTHLKNQGRFVKISPTKLSDWIIQYFYENVFDKKKEELYYSFSDHKAYAKELLMSGVPLIDIERSLRDFRRKKAENSKKSRKSRKLKGVESQSKTSASSQRKVEFE